MIKVRAPKKKPIQDGVDPGHVAGLAGPFLVGGTPAKDAIGKKGDDRFALAVESIGQRLAFPNATKLKWSILPPEKWIRDPYYCGGLARDWWPQKFKDFIAVAHGKVTEVILTGAIGGGKTELLKALCMYDAYRISCLEDPHHVLGLGRAESIVLVLISLNERKSIAKLYDPLRRLIGNAPYFNEHCRFDWRRQSQIVFPNGVVIKPGVTGESSVHSEDTIGLYASEVNFMPVVMESRKKRGIEVLDVAADLVEAVMRRMKTRFMKEGGVIPMCRLVLDSSRQFPDDFLERREAEVKRGEVKHNVMVISRSQWEARVGATDSNNNPFFCGETFPVEVGDKNSHSRILNHDEVPHTRGEVLHVPIEYQSDFERDVEGALRDIAGRAVLSLRLLVPHRNKIEDCFRTTDKGFDHYECVHPFSATTTSFRDSVRFRERFLFNPDTNKPWVNPAHPRTVHIDFSLTGDYMGIAVGHVGEMVTIARAREGMRLGLPCNTCRGEQTIDCPRCLGTGAKKQLGYKVRCSKCRGLKVVECMSCGGTGKHGVPVLRPRVHMDLILRVVPPTNGQIQYDDVEAFLRRLRAMGMWIPVVTADGTESAQFLQRQMKWTRVAEKVSVDVTKDPYYGLRNAIHDRDEEGRPRVTFYDYDPLVEELARLEDGPKKVDHPRLGEKDTADALAGVVYNCERLSCLQVFEDKPPIMTEIIGGDEQKPAMNSGSVPGLDGLGGLFSGHSY